MSGDLTPQKFFGEAYPQWAAAMEAVHAFAHRSGCRAGGDVIAWLASELERYQTAVIRSRPASPEAGVFREEG